MSSHLAAAAAAGEDNDAEFIPATIIMASER
jgi:hypothetical protein